MKKIFDKLVLFSFMGLLILSCDKDYNTLGSDILTDNGFVTGKIELPTVTYTKVLNPVRSNNLNNAFLGVYKDNIYGLSTANFVTQVDPNTFNPDFGEDPQIESVMLTIPYFSTRTGEVDEEGNNIYELDSIYGDQPIKLSIYQNTYFLRDLDPETNLEEQQLYYSNSNQTINFNNFTGQLLYEEMDFVPNASERVITEDDDEGNPEVVERLTPAIWVDLAETEDLKTFWSDLLFANQGSPELSNTNNFRDFFRGLYFKTEALNDDGTIYYHSGSGAGLLAE